MIRLTKSLAVVCVCAFASLTYAQKVDRDFLIEASTCGHAAVKYSEVAQKQASDPAVKEFANKMVKEHTKCNEELASMIKDTKIAIVVGAEKETRDELARLGKLSGADFDRAYMKDMVDGHEKAVRMLEDQIKSGKDEKLNTFAKDKLATLQAHLKEARDIAAKLK